MLGTTAFNNLVFWFVAWFTNKKILFSQKAEPRETEVFFCAIELQPSFYLPCVPAADLLFFWGTAGSQHRDGAQRASLSQTPPPPRRFFPWRKSRKAHLKTALVFCCLLCERRLENEELFSSSTETIRFSNRFCLWEWHGIVAVFIFFCVFFMLIF